MRELETTARIKRDELLALLAAMKPVEKQAITTRARISDVEAELARQRRSRSKTAAALLPRCTVTRFPRATPPPLLKRPKPRRVEQATAAYQCLPTLSPAIVAELSAEEIAMLPIEFRRMLPAVTETVGDSVEIHSVACGDVGHVVEVNEVDTFRRRTYFAILMACFVAAFVVGIFVAYLMR